MLERFKIPGLIASVLLLVLGIGLIVVGQGRWSVPCFVLAGIGMGVWGPPGDPGMGIHGASDST